MSSTPPGERGSSRTTPVIATLASCVSAPNAAQASSDTSFLDRTPCTVPVPSRSTSERDLPARPGRDDPAAHGDRLAHVRAQLADPYRRHASFRCEEGDVLGSVESSPAPGRRQRGLRATPAGAPPAPWRRRPTPRGIRRRTAGAPAQVWRAKAGRRFTGRLVAGGRDDLRGQRGPKGVRRRSGQRRRRSGRLGSAG